ncbi:MAG TPA: R3H domain-containing nucleic acid-binding protein [Thermoanaerobaculia bacterium]|jgi:spoIIIJ-associated protein|nr:R3H domain-containing nucleic acid-binding protein [Thermoanaerobaculia bacterium]
MNDVKRRYFSGDTLQQALVQAANYFNLDPGYVAYRSLEKRHGFLKTRRKVMIEVDPDNPRRETPVTVPPAAKSAPPPPPSTYLTHPAAAPAERIAPAPPAEAPAAPPREARPPREREREPRRERERGGDRPRHPSRDLPPRPPRPSSSEGSPEGGIVSLPEKPRGVGERYPEATGAMAEAATKATGILLRIAGLELTSKIFQGEERLEVDLSGEDVDWCFADDGEILMAFEHLLPRMIRTLSGGEPTAVRVDCDNFHEIREERLRSLAQRVAEEVRRRGKPSLLEPMNPGDRRIIHTTLADDPNVVTESEGDGYFKRIMVRPA